MAAGNGGSSGYSSTNSVSPECCLKTIGDQEGRRSGGLWFSYIEPPDLLVSLPPIKMTAAADWLDAPKAEAAGFVWAAEKPIENRGAGKQEVFVSYIEAPDLLA